MGLTREAAARFSFLLAIPVIVLAGIWQGRNLLRDEHLIQWDVMVFATAVSALVAFACIHLFLGFLRRFSMLGFVVYRLILGALILLLLA